MSDFDRNFPADNEYLADFPPKQRENQTALIEGRIVDAGSLNGLKEGNTSGAIPINNGTVNTNLNADMLDGKHSSDFAETGHSHSLASTSSDGYMSKAQVTKLNSIATNAEVNQNAFSNVTVGTTTIQADSPTDTLKLVAGTNIAITPDSTNDSVTIAVSGTVANATNATNATNADKATKDANGNVIADTYASKASAITGLSVNGKTITYTKGDNTTGTITTQDTNTTYSDFTGATSSAAGKSGLVPAPTAGSQAKFLRADKTWATPTDTKYTHPDSDVTAGTYRSVTVNAQGHVTGGSNPTITIAQGGTGATTAAAARNALGLGNTTGALPIANGGTGSTTVANALKALGINDAIVGLSVSGKTITYTQADGGTGTINTQDTSNGIIAANLAQNGYVKFANGLILQWGDLVNYSRNQIVPFPISFQNSCYCVVITTTRSDGDAYNNWVSAKQNKNFTINFYNTSLNTNSASWCSIGF